MNLNQVTVPVSDIKAGNAFYRTLGFTQIVDAPHYARFECPVGGATFSLALETDDFCNGAVLYFEREDLEAWVDSLIARGIEFDQLPRDEPYLWTEAVLRDPSGNRIKLYRAGENRRYPPWRLASAPQAESTRDLSFPGTALSPAVFPRALRVAAVVGTLLLLINYGDKLVAMSLTGADLLKILLTYLVPYGVSTWSAVQAIAARRGGERPTPNCDSGQ